MTDFKLRQQRAHYHYTTFQECCHDPKGSFSARKDPPLPFGQCMWKRNVGEAALGLPTDPTTSAGTNCRGRRPRRPGHWQNVCGNDIGGAMWASPPTFGVRGGRADTWDPPLQNDPTYVIQTLK